MGTQNQRKSSFDEGFFGSLCNGFGGFFCCSFVVQVIFG